MKNLLSIIIILVLFSTSCTTYDYGPLFSLRSATFRLTGEWTLEMTLVNDRNDLVLFEKEKNYVYQFDSNGRAVKTKLSDSREIYAYTGSWKLEQDRQMLIIEFDESEKTDSENYKYEILRLTNSELWVLEPGDGILAEHRIERRFIKTD